MFLYIILWNNDLCIYIEVINRIENPTTRLKTVGGGKLNQAGRSPARYTSTFGGNRKGGDMFTSLITGILGRSQPKQLLNIHFEPKLRGSQQPTHFYWVVGTDYGTAVQN